MKTNNEKTVTIKLLSYNELNPAAKNKAYQDWYNQLEYHWHDYNMQSFDAFCEHFNIECKNWQYDEHSYSFKFDVQNENIEEISGRKLYAYINRKIQQIKPPKLYYKGGINGKTKFRKSLISTQDTFNLSGYYMDYSFYLPIKEHLQKPDYTKTYRQLMNESIDSFFKECCADKETYFSQETFEEECDTNNYLFFSNGKQYEEGMYELAS